MTATPADLLTALLDACRRGLVTHCEAAKLVGIRKEDMGDLVAWRMVEVTAWRGYESAFNGAFPECNARLLRSTAVGLREDDLMRGGPPSECRHYGAEEAASLLMREPENGDSTETSCGDKPPPGVSPRVLPRVVGQQLTFDWAA